jgi:addiction module HigA family antidote
VKIVAEYKVTKKSVRQPTHPGAVLVDMLEDTGLSVSAFSRGIHLSRQQVHKILAENAPVTPEGAVKIGRFLGNGPELWLKLQVKYDLWMAEQSMQEEIEPYQIEA